MSRTGALTGIIDEELAVRTNRPGASRTAGVLPRKDYNPAELARQARHQAREEARQRSRTATNTHAAIPGDYGEDDFADIDGNGDDWPPPMPTITRRYDLNNNGVPLRQRRVDHYHETPFISPRQPAQEQKLRSRDSADAYKSTGLCLQVWDFF